MSIRGVLETDQGLAKYDTVYTTANGKSSDSSVALAELVSFYIRHLSTQFLPYSDSIVYPSAVQKQVYAWMNGKYSLFIDLLLDKFKSNEPGVVEMIKSIMKNDSKAVCQSKFAVLICETGLTPSVMDLLQDLCLQKQLYAYLSDRVQQYRSLCLELIKINLPTVEPSNEFSKLYISVVTSPLSSEECIEILKSFGSIVNRVDEKLITFEFLRQQLEAGSYAASLSIPNIVSVSVNRAVDIANFYDIAFSSLTIESLSGAGRSAYLDTLTRVLSPKTLPSHIPVAFAVKLSRFLPSLSPSSQQDVLYLLHYIMRAHDAVLRLLKPMEGEISEVNKSIIECKPQTLWEVLALTTHSVPTIADAARTLGQKWVPPGFECFDVRTSIASAHIPSQKNMARAVWTQGLIDKLWTK